MPLLELVTFELSVELGTVFAFAAVVEAVPLSVLLDDAIDVGSEPVVAVDVVLQPARANIISSAAPMAKMSLFRSSFI